MKKKKIQKEIQNKMNTNKNNILIRTFDSKYYPSLMFIAIITVTLLILFNFVGILDKTNIKNKNFVTAHVIEENSTKSNLNQTGQTEMYTIKSYSIFYFMLIGLVLVIGILSLRVLFPRIKNYT
jgi:hypothetical protein